MTTKTRMQTIWRVPDALWAIIAPSLGPEKAPGTVGRPAVPYRRIVDGILYVLRTGGQWQAIPRHLYAPGSTVHGRFRQWVKADLFQQWWITLLQNYDETIGIDWKWQSLDTAITKAPLGGEATGPSPVDRGKCGTKRSLLTDRRGAPLALVVTAAQRHDKKVALQTLDAVVVPRPPRRVYRVQHLCLDKGYDYDDTIADMHARDYIVHRKRRGQPARPRPAQKKYPARRWVVERTQAWQNKFRRLLVRWERKQTHFEAMLHLASVLILFRLCSWA